MRVLMISGDPTVLDPNTEAGQRTEEYRKVLGTLDILLCRGSVWSFAVGFFRGLKMMQKGYDIITAQDMEHSVLAWIFSKIFGAPWQIQIHADIFSPYFVKHTASPAGGSVLNKIRVLLANFLIPRADCVRVVSERIKLSLTPYGVRHTAIIVLPIFVDVEKIKNAPIKTDLHQKYGRDKFIILMASRLTYEKNIKLALSAIHSLISAEGGQARLLASGGNKRTTLVIVGNGPELDNLKFKVKSEKLEEFVKFEPYTKDLASYYKTCDLFLLTSNYEGYGRTLIEAASVGTKIISSDVGIAPEILEKEAIFKVGDKEDLKQKLILAFAGKLPAPKAPKPITKEEYLKLYKESLSACGK